jgi:pilus assembly protein CpaB
VAATKQEFLASFRGSRVRTSTFVMIGFAVLFGLLAVFLAQIWINNQADERLKSIEAQRKAAPPARTIVVATKALRFGDELNASALREMPWPDNALPAGAFGKIAELTSGKRVVLMPIDTNEAVLAAKITGPGQRATLSAMLSDGMKAITIRVNDVEGVAGFVLPGDRVDVLLTRTGEKNNAINDVVLQDVRVLAIDQLADQRAEKPSVVKAVTIEVDPTQGQKVALASTVGTLSLLLRKAGEMGENNTRRVTTGDLTTAPSQDSHFVTVGVMRPSQRERVEYTVPVEQGEGHSASVVNREPARN